MYQALYRKYRSQTFGEMVGQKVISTTLKQAVESGKSAMPISFLVHVVLVRPVQQKFLLKQ
ncbi:DNA polymerase III subunits gamma and tau [Streptococcus sp. HSISS2]|nr:DNA polymerase III subunits gamma and tau [Streptococcus sp. HSISS2]